MRNSKIYISFFVSVLIVLASCSVQKNTATSRTYHNLTAHYNAFFNGKDAYKQGTKKVDKTIQDNFSLIIPVFPFSDKTAASSSVGNMDIAIKKTSKVIKLHSITSKPKRKKKGKLTPKEKEFFNKKEYCKWIDDSWQLMGQSHFYKHDFFLAREAFEYVIKEYVDNPIRYNSAIWLARTHNELKDYDKALRLLENAEGDKDFPKKLRKDLALTYADTYLKQRKYEDAMPYLVKAVSMEKRKRVKARYQYILAQLYQKYNQYRNASNLYREVIKANPKYEMAFSAKINRATSFDISHGDSREIKKQLNKMLKDDKNIDYRDQIYFALANIEYKEKNAEKAVELFKKSATESTSNTDQKAMSFLSLADIYFSWKDYLNAQAYYDSSLAFLSELHPDYESIQLKTQNLTDLVENLTIISTEDSLQKVAQMSEKERNKLIEGLIQKIKDEEARIKQLEQEQQINMMTYHQNQDQINKYNTDQGGKWYFYNPSALSFGRSQFIKKWGKRKLEDNWRRKNKAIVSYASEDDIDENAVDSVKKVLDNKSTEYYLQDLPLNDSLMVLSHERIETALYKAGGVYKNQLLDYPKAISTFEELIKRYPNTVYLLNTYYQLYKLYILTDDKAKADYYKNLIVTKYPKSNYANALTNPNYFQVMAEKDRKAEQFYADTYNQYIKRNYIKVLENCSVADTSLNESSLFSKFSLLKALTIGSIRDLTNFRKALKYIIKTFPETDEKKTAELLYTKVKSSDFAFSDSGLIVYNGLYNIEEVEDTLIIIDTTSAVNVVEVNLDEIYSYNEESPHFYAMIVGTNTDINRLKFNIISYNIDNFNMFDFAVSAVELDAANQIITIKMLDNQKQGLAYFKRISKDINSFFADMKKPDYKHFIITQDNYSVLFNDKNVDQYLKYFKQKYKLQE
ncbi:MAG: tetratricopeptide repeat protein [Bacteroidota bacterium]